ncbi:MAG: mycothiol conjugate amidase Mca [Acidimicrobiaceae bacterium]|nr:mycothiol conjugate amidase Mca [Acidimicrobiia bacterium]MCY4494377.1 mycothiol conjugate amidase Mca [Acidimicrobiaceae bacterium]
MHSFFRLLSIHAHPDDEASKGSATVAKYKSMGVATVLVCCTGGEEGDILNPAMDRPEVREDIGAVRRAELSAAAEIIGYDTVHMLGYRDSGMADSEANSHPDCFAAAPFDEVVDRLVALLRAERPHVVVTYPDEQGGYNHPDHVRVHDITHPAVQRCADGAHRRDLGAPWSVSKVYYSSWSRARIETRHQAFLDLGLESPYDERWFERPDTDHTITTKVDVVGFTDVRRKGLLAHATQIDPESPFWFGLPEELDLALYPVDDYRLAWPEWNGDQPEETDLFAGIEP